mmetsp:Transcript_6137/g.18393  ORF Transcript_6137/g.18393 Transcript_6137/m.18393 type:complete len:259 (-) Transcript_6137:278-1054(-)
MRLLRLPLNRPALVGEAEEVPLVLGDAVPIARGAPFGAVRLVGVQRLPGVGHAAPLALRHRRHHLGLLDLQVLLLLTLPVVLVLGPVGHREERPEAPRGAPERLAPALRIAQRHVDGRLVPGHGRQLRRAREGGRRSAGVAHGHRADVQVARPVAAAHHVVALSEEHPDVRQPAGMDHAVEVEQDGWLVSTLTRRQRHHGVVDPRVLRDPPALAARAGVERRLVGGEPNVAHVQHMEVARAARAACRRLGDCHRELAA